MQFHYSVGTEFVIKATAFIRSFSDASFKRFQDGCLSDCVQAPDQTAE